MILIAGAPCRSPPEDPLYTLTYNGKKKDFESTVTIREIRREFNIPERKHLYRKGEDGSLEKLNDHNFREKARSVDELEALSDFKMGAALPAEASRP